MAAEVPQRTGGDSAVQDAGRIEVAQSGDERLHAPFEGIDGQGKKKILGVSLRNCLEERPWIALRTEDLRTRGRVSTGSPHMVALVLRCAKLGIPAVVLDSRPLHLVRQLAKCATIRGAVERAALASAKHLKGLGEVLGA